MNAVRSIMSHPPAHSYWDTTATPLAAYPAMRQSGRFDVIVVGAGYTGLSCALQLAQTGANVCVIEAHQPGWGASGRNGGQVNPTLKYDPDELVQLLGDKSEPLIHTIADSADAVFELIKKHQIACDPVRSGWLQAGYSKSEVSRLYARAKQWQTRGYPVELLDRNAIESRTGSQVFYGGWIDKRAGNLQPMSYVRGLAKAAADAGAIIYGDSQVVKLARDGQRWTVHTAAGAQASATQLVLATNSYSDGLWPGLAQSILAANSFIVATNPLGDRAAHVLPFGETLSTAKRILIYMRKERDGRILIGGRGLFHDPKNEADFAHIERSLANIYPEIAPFQFDYRWAGRVAITRDYMPHVHQPAPGVTLAVGYNGRGIATATVIGREIARLIGGGLMQDFPFPVTKLSRIPLHGVMQSFYISAGVAWYSLLDRISR